MNNTFKKFFLWLVSIAVVFFVSLKIGSELHTQMLNISDYFKKLFLEISENTDTAWSKYFDQAQTIDTLNERLKDEEERKLTNLALESENRILRQILYSHENVHASPQTSLVRILSYIQLGNFERVWLEHSLTNMREGRIFGLVFDNNVVGIALSSQGRLMGLLNGDPNNVYSVYIGANKAPGIITGSPNKNMLTASYIPQWIRISEGDEVITSGLDGIFFEGIKVGKVVSIRISREYFIAEIEPYVDVYNLHYLWLIDLDMEDSMQPKTPALLLDTNLTNKDTP